MCFFFKEKENLRVPAFSNQTKQNTEKDDMRLSQIFVNGWMSWISTTMTKEAHLNTVCKTDERIFYVEAWR